MLSSASGDDIHWTMTKEGSEAEANTASSMARQAKGGVYEKRGQTQITGGEQDPKSGDDDSGHSARTSAWRASRANSLWTIYSCALANLSDGIQQGLASPTNVMLKDLFTSKVYTSIWQTRLSNALLIGSIVGILLFGWTSDRYSRRTGMLFASFLVVLGTLLSTLTFQIPSDSASSQLGTNVLWYMTIARGIAGVGVGGEYPSSAAAALESSAAHFNTSRGPILVGISTLMATLASPLFVLIYLLTLLGSESNLIRTFHTLYAIATIVPLLVATSRLLQRSSSPLFLAAKSHFGKSGIPWLMLFRTQKQYLWRLIGTSTAFFLYDFVNFPNSILSAALINDLAPDQTPVSVAQWQLLLASLPVPGVLLGAWLVNTRLGRRGTGMLGFGGYVVLGAFIGGFYDTLTTHSSLLALFVVLYGLLNAVGHMGPGATIGLISVEAFPTAIRGMAYGIAAGFGKAGGAVGTQVFDVIEASVGKAGTFYVACGVGVVGMGVYWLLPETGLESLVEMDRGFERGLREGGWFEGRMGGEEELHR